MTMRFAKVTVGVLLAFGCQAHGQTCSENLQTAEIVSGNVQAHGVNLGSWLVVENWMSKQSPIFTGTAATGDGSGEYDVMTKLGHDVGDGLFDQHRSTMYSQSDFASMAAQGINMARVPVGYWIKEFDNSGGDETAWQVYAPGSMNYLQNALDWGCAEGIAILVCLHAAKGSQNGQEHSAPVSPGVINWAAPSQPENIQDSIDTVNWLVTTYGSHPAFVGVDMLNEPNYKLPTATLQKYYIDTYNTVRQTSDCILVHAPILQTEQHPGAYGNWETFMPSPQYYNLWHTWHLYYAYSGDATTAVTTSVQNDSAKISQWSSTPGTAPLLIGEWSLATHTTATTSQKQQLGQEELAAYGQGQAGYTFWAWKWYNGANGGGWTLLNSFQSGIITYPSS